MPACCSIMNFPVACVIGVIMAFGLIANLAGAQTTADKGKLQKEGWETGLNAGLNLTSGNSKTLLLSIPTPDHYLPLLYVLGARVEDDTLSFPVEGTDGGSVSMLAVRFG